MKLYAIRAERHPGEYRVVEVSTVGSGCPATYTSRAAAAKALVKQCTAIQTRLAMSKAEARRLLKEGKAARADRREGLTP